MSRLEKGMRFVIICAPRTGSSHLVSVLSGHPELFVSGNVFDDRRRKRLYVFWPPEELTPEVKTELLDLRRSDPEAFLERIFSRNFGRRHVGFKIFKGENDEILDRMMRDTDVRKVVLYRRNVLANFSSALVARKTGQYGLKEGKVTDKIPKIKFSAERFIKFHNKYTGFFQFVTTRLNALGKEFYFLNYEDINEKNILANLITFIGGDPRKPMLKENQFKRQTKQNSTDILSRFSNSQEVEEFLRQHNLLHWMHEGELCFSPSSFDFNTLDEGVGACV